MRSEPFRSDQHLELDTSGPTHSDVEEHSRARHLKLSESDLMHAHLVQGRPWSGPQAGVLGFQDLTKQYIVQIPILLEPSTAYIQGLR